VLAECIWTGSSWNEAHGTAAACISCAQWAQSTVKALKHRMRCLNFGVLRQQNCSSSLCWKMAECRPVRQVVTVSCKFARHQRYMGTVVWSPHSEHGSCYILYSPSSCCMCSERMAVAHGPNYRPRGGRDGCGGWGTLYEPA
jgi:hypothetical protein